MVIETQEEARTVVLALAAYMVNNKTKRIDMDVPEDPEHKLYFRLAMEMKIMDLPLSTEEQQKVGILLK